MNVFSILLLLFTSLLPVQHSPLPLNAAGKVHFEEFVAIAALGRDALLRNAISHAIHVQKVSDRAAKVRTNFKEGVVQQEGSFYVYKKGLFTPQVHGEIMYTLQLTVADGGFTYTFYDFVFQYYQKNRYGQFEALSGKIKGLEEEKFAGMQDLWEEHKKTTRQHIDLHIATLKANMKKVPPGALLYDEQPLEEQN